LPRLQGSMRLLRILLGLADDAKVPDLLARE
jgi:hypothetical protein